MFFPWGSPPRSPWRFWLRSSLLLLGIAVLTYYAKFRSHEPQAVREHGLLGWVLPNGQSLSALVVLPDDANDYNNIRTGLRIWINPPRHPLQWERQEFILYRGPMLALVGDSVAESTLREAAQMLDGSGTILLLGQQAFSDSLLRTWVYPQKLRLGRPDSLPWNWFSPGEGEFAIRLQRTRDGYRLQLRGGGYHIEIAPQAQECSACDSASSLLVLTSAQSRIPSVQSQALVMFGHGLHSPDSSRIVWSDSSTGVVWVEGSSGLRLRRFHRPSLQQRF